MRPRDQDGNEYKFVIHGFLIGQEELTVSERIGYSIAELRALHAKLDAEHDEIQREAEDAAAAYRIAEERRNDAHNRFRAAKAKRGLVRRMLAELEQPGRYGDDLSPATNDVEQEAAL